jgi:hypothetical protein
MPLCKRSSKVQRLRAEERFSNKDCDQFLLVRWLKESA